MKNFGAILMVLAAAASSVAAMPAPVADTHGVQARAPMFYALEVREPNREKKGKKNGNGGAAGNGTAIANPANNGTANAGNGNDNGKGKGHGKGNGKGKGKGKGDGNKGKGQDNGQNNAADAAAQDPEALLNSLLALLDGNKGPKQPAAAQ